MEFPSGIVDEIRQIHLKMKEEVRRLRAEAGELENTEKIWAKFEQFMAKGWALHFISLLEKEAPRFNKMKSERHPVIPHIEEASCLAREEAQRIMRRFPALLEEASLIF